jgi:hypothetical protein
MIIFLAHTPGASDGSVHSVCCHGVLFFVAQTHCQQPERPERARTCVLCEVLTLCNYSVSMEKEEMSVSSHAIESCRDEGFFHIYRLGSNEVKYPSRHASWEWNYTTWHYPARPHCWPHCLQHCVALSLDRPRTPEVCEAETPSLPFVVLSFSLEFNQKGIQKWSKEK